MIGRHAATRAHADAILRAAITAADPAPLVARSIRSAADFTAHDSVRVLAIGKAAATMCAAALAALDTLGARVSDTLVIVPHDADTDPLIPALPDGNRVMRASHPLPDDSSEVAGHAIERMLRDASEDDVVFVLLSGGASSLAVLPIDGLTVEDYAHRVDRIMRAGGDITTLNTERRRIDRLKAGGMARLAQPAHVVGLVLSDVIGDPLDIIASGPLTPDGESPANVTIHVIGNNDVALDGAARCATELGYTVRRLARPLTGEARAAGAWLAREAVRIQDEISETSAPVCLLAGGETTVTVTGDGKGGRNQELALSAGLVIDAANGITIASAGTDGIDGPTDAAGAIVDPWTVQRATQAGLNAAHALERNDSHTLLRAIGDTFSTGPTGTNVLDVQVALILPRTAGYAPVAGVHPPGQPVDQSR